MLSHLHTTLEFCRQKGVFVCRASDKILLCVTVRVNLLYRSVWVFNAIYIAVFFFNLKVQGLFPTTVKPI